MKTKKQLYESPHCAEFSVNIASRNICSTSPIEYDSSLEGWKEEDLDLD